MPENVQQFIITDIFILDLACSTGLYIWHVKHIKYQAVYLIIVIAKKISPNNIINTILISAYNYYNNPII